MNWEFDINSYPYIFATNHRRPYIVQTENVVRSNDLSLKYRRFTPSGCKDLGLELVSLWQRLNSFGNISAGRNNIYVGNISS